MVPELDFSRLNSDNLQEKLFFVKELAAYASKEPMKVYSHFDEIATLLQSDKKVLIWNALKIIGRLALVDKNKKIELNLDDITAMLNKGNLITAKNAMEALSLIAYAKRDLTEGIVVNLLQVPTFSYETPESDTIAAGKALVALTKLYPLTTNKTAIKNMAEKHLKTERPAALANAEELFKKLDAEKN